MNLCSIVAWSHRVVKGTLLKTSMGSHLCFEFLPVAGVNRVGFRLKAIGPLNHLCRRTMPGSVLVYACLSLLFFF
uniref:Uncharacterized protein n=1 Tax=Anopheles atroparvus TaxID=41427 RepID=A0AAG5D4X6_ANOAO